MKNYKVDWLFLATMTWMFLAGGVGFNLLFLDGESSMLHYKTLALIALITTPVLIALSVSKKTE